MKTDPRDVAIKLVALATNNPSDAEATRAAIRAIALIDKYDLLRTAPVSPAVKEKRTTPPSRDMEELIKDILNGKAWGEDAFYKKLEIVPDSDLTDYESAFRDQMKEAWRAIRAERKRIEAEWYRLKQRGVERE